MHYFEVGMLLSPNEEQKLQQDTKYNYCMCAMLANDLSYRLGYIVMLDKNKNPWENNCTQLMFTNYMIVERILEAAISIWLMEFIQQSTERYDLLYEINLYMLQASHKHGVLNIDRVLNIDVYNCNKTTNKFATKHERKTICMCGTKTTGSASSLAFCVFLYQWLFFFCMSTFHELYVVQKNGFISCRILYTNNSVLKVHI